MDPHFSYFFFFIFIIIIILLQIRCVAIRGLASFSRDCPSVLTKAADALCQLFQLGKEGRDDHS